VTRYVTPDLDWDTFSGRGDPEQRFALYRLCDCTACGGTGKSDVLFVKDSNRCYRCRGEGRVRELLATCATPEAVGVALVTLAREGEWEECPLGLLDREGEKGKKWLILPWLPSPRNVSEAGRTLAKSKKRPTPS